jgi:hypothetical protein
LLAAPQKGDSPELVQGCSVLRGSCRLDHALWERNYLRGNRRVSTRFGGLLALTIIATNQLTDGMAQGENLFAMEINPKRHGTIARLASIQATITKGRTRIRPSSKQSTPQSRSRLA